MLRADGFEVSLINSDPATIMTDPNFADRTYIEPLHTGVGLQVIEREKPDALLPTLGGQTGLNVSVALAEVGRPRAARRPHAGGLARGDPQGRGPQLVQAGDAGGGAGRAARRRAHTLEAGARARRRTRLPVDPAAVLHARRRRQRLRAHATGAGDGGRAGAREQPGERGARRGVDRRVEGVRARGDARRRRQRRDRLLDRERRSDGRAHRRLDHGGARSRP